MVKFSSHFFSYGLCKGSKPFQRLLVINYESSFPLSGYQGVIGFFSFLIYRVVKN